MNEDDPKPADKVAEPVPHYHGHRARLRDRFLANPDGLPDYELLELVFAMARPRGDVKPLAKALITRFGSFADAIAAAPARLKEVEGIGDATVAALKLSKPPRSASPAATSWTNRFSVLGRLCSITAPRAWPGPPTSSSGCCFLIGRTC